MKIKRTTPIMTVEAIEPLLAFWRDTLGFQLTMEVPHGKHLGFVGLARDGEEVMLQTTASIQDDLPAILQRLGRHWTALFHEVDDLDAVISATKGQEVLVPPRETFYGMRELWLVDPAGYVHGFAQPIDKKG